MIYQTMNVLAGLSPVITEGVIQNTKSKDTKKLLDCLSGGVLGIIAYQALQLTNSHAPLKERIIVLSMITFTGIIFSTITSAQSEKEQQANPGKKRNELPIAKIWTINLIANTLVGLGSLYRGQYAYAAAALYPWGHAAVAGLLEKKA